jgi:DUF1680 family protein
MENHAKYGDSIYFKSDDALYVNLFIHPTVTWRERGLTLRRRRAFPMQTHTRLTIKPVGPGERRSPSANLRGARRCE